MNENVTFFGYTSKQEETHLYKISNAHGMTALLSDYGATLVSLKLLVENKMLDVVLGYDTVSDYEANVGQLGATVGRNANRICGGVFSLNGITYELSKDMKGNNSHSGPNFFNKRLWKVANVSSSSISFLLSSPHMDQGFPGNMELTVTYSLDDSNTLSICYDALSDQDTICNVTNHSYFNLDGHEGESVLSHELWIDSNQITIKDDANIPTGEFLDVENTLYDFSSLRPITHEFDHNWCLKNQGSFSLCAKLYSPNTKIMMETYTDLPGVQIYTGNALHNLRGKEGIIYKANSGICLESQYFVNAINIPHFKQPILLANIPYSTKTAYKFLIPTQFI